MALASRIQTPDVLAAALDLNRDKAATLAARIASLEILLAEYRVGVTLRPLGVSWATLLSVPTSGCAHGTVASGSYIATATMPTDYANTIAARVDSLANDATEPQVLRALAGCVRSATLSDVPNVVSASAISLLYVCGTKFKVHNSSASWASLTYDVQGTNDHGSVQAAPNADTTFLTLESGSTRLSLNGQVIQTIANGQTPCP